MDFSKLGNVQPDKKPLHPIEIFEKLPSLPNTPNDLWRGQTEALNAWHNNRKTSDIVIALNTGAGKTLVGLLVAQSLSEVLHRHKVEEQDSLKYQFPNLRDRLNKCALVFGRGSIEITPPFLPSLALDVFERRVRRVYLSATLNYKTDFVRAFGRMPQAYIEPKSDAGNGERLILFSRTIPSGFSPKFIAQLSKRHKVLVAVPSYRAAENWEYVGKPPEYGKFTEALNAFRRAKFCASNVAR